MTLRKARFNNMKLHYIRETEIYEGVLLDLYLIGALPKETVEKLTGRQIPAELSLPAELKDVRKE